jgi:molecular chaperone GrpE (heat shock protein)
MNPENNGEISNEYYKKLNQQIVQKDNLIKLLQLQIRNLKTQIETDGSSGAKDLEELKKALEEKADESEKLQSELEEQKALFLGLEDEKNKEIEKLNQILQEKDDSAGDELNNRLKALEEELEAKSAELEEKSTELKEKSGRLEELAAGANISEAKNQEDANKILELENTINSLKETMQALEDQALASSGASASSEELAEATNKLEELTAEYEQLNAKLESLENENEELQVELAAFKTLDAEGQQLNAQNSAIDEYVQEINNLREANSKKDEEIALLRVELERLTTEAGTTISQMDEMELTNQIADQLLAIQNFETRLKNTQMELDSKENEIAILKTQLEDAKNYSGQAEAQIPVEGESAIISSFIDFFDGLDSIISKNPLPELQMLHQRLLDRLITPNQISYMQVISEAFDPKKHVATDYFLSNSFPERCIVFEVEKGYTKGDMVVKKSKVWVVQNLYPCPKCNTMQSSPDSKFCHLCGTQIMAPNGLSIDSLPEFEPTAITYGKFAERMLEKGDTQRGKDYILKGLEIDSNYLPLILSYADILSNESSFDEALAMLNKANSIKQDPKTEEKIAAIETKLNIYNQAKNLKLSQEEIEKLLQLIQK